MSGHENEKTATMDVTSRALANMGLGTLPPLSAVCDCAAQQGKMLCASNREFVQKVSRLRKDTTYLSEVRKDELLTDLTYDHICPAMITKEYGLLDHSALLGKILELKVLAQQLYFDAEFASFLAD